MRRATLSIRGNPNVVPSGIHDCYFDYEGNMWIGGNTDAIAQKYSRDGKMLLQIGTKGKFDTSDGAAKGDALNSSHTLLNKPASFAVGPANGEVYIADGYGDKVGNFKKNIFIKRRRADLPGNGSPWWLLFSRDKAQQYIYVADGLDEVIWALNRESGKALSGFGRLGHMAGEFTFLHTIAMNSKGDLFSGETVGGRRVQKFKAAGN